MPRIIGIDILAGSSSQKGAATAKRFAAVIIEDGKILENSDSISMRKLIKLCRKYEPEFLSVDNIFELETNSAKIIQFCSLLPLETKIIQVTGAPPDGFEPLRRLAKRHKVPYPSRQHPDPLQTAEIIARLAEKRIGYVLLPFEEETEIKISRTRAIGPGGWSQQRYSRKMRGEILRLTREMEKQLQDHNIDYDLEVRKTPYGYDRAVFRAYASLKEIKKIVSPFKGELARVTIQPIRKKRLEFIPASGEGKTVTKGRRRHSNRGLIVGLDPGPTTGIAVLNFAGKVLFIDSLRSPARGDIIRKITQLGDPILVAADVRPPPEFVVKIAKMLNAMLYYPEKLLSADEKNQIVNDFTANGIKVKGAHKRDSLAAAIKAYYKYADLLEKIDGELREAEDFSLRNAVKKIVIREKKNIQDAIAFVREQAQEVERPEIRLEEERELTEFEQALTEKIEALKELIDRQITQIENLEDLNEELSEEVKTLQRDNRKLKQKIKKITRKRTMELKRDRVIKTKDDEIAFLRKEVKELTAELSKVKGTISDLKRMIVMSSSRVVVPMKVVYEFSREGIEKTIERMNIEPHEVVLLVNPSGGGKKTAEMLIEREIKAVVCKENNISDQAMAAFIEADIPVLFEMPIRQIDDIAVTYFDELEQALSDWEKQRREILSEKTEKKLGEIIAEYQSERKKELSKLFPPKRKKVIYAQPHKAQATAKEEKEKGEKIEGID